MENNPTKRYDIYGVVYNTACRMPSDQRNDPWLLCSAICGALDEYLEKLAREQLIRVSPRVNTTNDGMMLFNIFDTEHTDDIPADIKPKKPTISKMEKVQKTATKSKTEPVVMPAAPTEPSDNSEKPNDPDYTNIDNWNLPTIEINTLWQEKPIDIKKNYIGKYSNPCSTSLGKCGGPCWQTEIWLYNKETDWLSTVDVEFPDLETLHKTLDPYIEYAKKHHKEPVWIDPNIAEQQEKIVAECREYRKNRAEQDAKLQKHVAPTSNKDRLNRFVELYNQGWKIRQIAEAMDTTYELTRARKNYAKKKGLIK